MTTARSQRYVDDRRLHSARGSGRFDQLTQGLRLGSGTYQRLALQASLTSTQYAMFERGRLEDGRSEGRVLVEGGRVGWWR